MLTRAYTAFALAGALLMLSSLLVSAGRPMAAEKAFTVADSIGLTKLVEPDELIFTQQAPFSASKLHFYVVSKRGNLASGENQYELRVFQSQDVLQFLNDPTGGHAPIATVAARFSTKSNLPAIDHAIWLQGGESLGFIGRGIDGQGQVYLYDCATSALRQLTHHAGDVASFAIAPSNGTIIYSSYLKYDHSVRDESGYVVNADNAMVLTGINPDLGLRYFVSELGSNQEHLVDIEPALYTNGSARQIAISPNGRWAILEIPVRHYPLAWAGYEFIARELNSRPAGDTEPAQMQRRQIRDEDYIFGPDEWINQAYLVDLQTHSAKPLIDAPQLMLGLTFEQQGPQWSPDSASVVLPSTLLPLDPFSSTTSTYRRSAVVMAEVDINVGSVSPILDLADQMLSGTSGGRPLVNPSSAHFAWTGNSSISIYTSDGSGSLYGPDAAEHWLRRTYRRTKDAWSLQRSSRVAVNAIGESRLRVLSRQGMNAPVELIAQDMRSKRERVLWNPNPQLAEKTIGQVQTFNWKDRFGMPFRGGLFLPPDYVPGQRYPLAFQFGFFDPEKFETDAGVGITTAMAARATANKGIVVFEPSREFFVAISKAAVEGSAVVQQVEDAIDALDHAAIIDRARVGLVGFSRTGMWTHTFLAFSKYPIVAATVADSVSMSPSCYAGLYGLPYPSMLEFEEPHQLGAPFWAEGIQQWEKRSYFFHLDQIRAPIRYEQHVAPYLCDWETFAILKRMERPVEMTVFPLSVHNLEKPAERSTSQGGNVDWLAFWLTGVEDSDPNKRDQYARWHVLRAQRDRAMRVGAGL